MSVRLHLFFAARAPRALILRESPGWWHAIGWDTDDHSFTHGQWMRHQIYPDRAALSPDGVHFLYFAVDGQWDRPARGSYTVIARAPNFDPIALYPEGDTLGGGGYFVDEVHYVIQSGRATEDIVGLAPHLNRANSMRNASRAPRVARMFGRRRASDARTPPDVRTEGGALRGGCGKLLADFTKLEAPDVSQT